MESPLVDYCPDAIDVPTINFHDFQYSLTGVNLLDCTSMYKRVLLKISGEQLAGKSGSGLDQEVAKYLADEVKKSADAGSEVVIMVGGGNFVRGAHVSSGAIKRVTGDQMGMLATMINALALTDIFEGQDIRTRCLSNIFAEQVAEPFVNRLARKHLEHGRVVIVAGGCGQPFLTTDTAAVILGLQLDCDIVLKATKVDGIYDKDPAKNTGAIKLEAMSHQEAVANEDIKVMDKAAMGLAMDHNMQVIVFDPMVPGNIAKAAAGELVGTKIS